MVNPFIIYIFPLSNTELPGSSLSTLDTKGEDPLRNIDLIHVNIIMWTAW